MSESTDGLLAGGIKVYETDVGLGVKVEDLISLMVNVKIFSKRNVTLDDLIVFFRNVLEYHAKEGEEDGDSDTEQSGS